MSTSLPERLTWARNESGLSQRGLAKLAKVSSAYIANVERGMFGIGADRGLRVCAVLGIQLGWLLHGTGDQPTTEGIKAATERARAEAPTEDASDEPRPRRDTGTDG